MVWRCLPLIAALSEYVNLIECREFRICVQKANSGAEKESATSKSQPLFNGRNLMKSSTNLFFGVIFSFVVLASFNAHAEVVNYRLENVVLDDGTQMYGEFSWTYDIGDFENGVGQFTYLEIPHTSHNHTDLNATIDVGQSIEITLPGSTHDDGVDITLFLETPLTPTTSALLDLVRSKYEIGGNGFHDGFFLSGSVSPVVSISVVGPDFFMVTRGSHVSGGIVELEASDNADLSIQRSASDIQSRTEFEVQAVSPVAIPSLLEVTLEGSVFARSQVDQSIELYNFVTGMWEQIDLRAATRFSDSTTTASPAGDFSRFVQSVTMRVEARIRYQSPAARQQFSSNTDQFVWRIGQ